MTDFVEKSGVLADNLSQFGEITEVIVDNNHYYVETYYDFWKISMCVFSNSENTII